MTEPTEHRQSRPALPTSEELAGLPPDGGPRWNRLVFEKSPYLLQHAANPVDWYPWGEEAFARARELDKPVFLSIGYSTCHWCHVMEHESFEDSVVAALMNEVFVCIKVDREERPDIDHVYMTVTQALTGNGGWPMTIVMTPDKKPFLAGTYFPKEGRYGRPGMIDLIRHLAELWNSDRGKVTESAEYIAKELPRITGSFPGGTINRETLERSCRMMHERFDSRHGGFGGRPKFPVPHNLSFLLHHHRATGDAQALEMAAKTLTQMWLGGIYDKVGFGFHRYSTDEQWLVPHFEKMLYDQALMIIVYTEAWQITAEPLFRQAAEEVIAYVLRDMTSPEGGFYSAEDADSEGEEGKFYVWSTRELVDILGESDAALYSSTYNMESGGNFHEESTGRLMGTNIPHLARSLDETAAERGIDPNVFRATIERCRLRLFEAREKRIHPLKDDKILTDWNGLMIAALARAGRAFQNDTYIHSAAKAADFILTAVSTPDGRLLKRYRLGEAALPAHLEDYAFIAWGLTELYEASLDSHHLIEAHRIATGMVGHFRDEQGHGFFQTANDGEPLLVRGKDAYDGAIPSGNSVAAYTLLRLARMTGNFHFEEIANETFEAFSRAIEQSPMNFSFMMMAYDFASSPTTEIVLAGNDVDTMAAELGAPFLPNVVVVRRPPELPAKLAEIAPFLKSMVAMDGRPTAYICRNFACEKPITDFDEFSGRVAELAGTHE